MKTKIEVEINKIKVEKGYFCFKYSVTINDNFMITIKRTPTCFNRWMNF